MRHAHAVDLSHALAWYAEAMRLWKRGPLTFCALAFATLVANVALELLPRAGIVAAQAILPLLECSLLYASLAADRGDRPRLRHLIAIAGARPAALAAVIVAGSIVFGIEALVALQAGGIDMLAPGSGAATISPGSLLVTYAAGMLVSLPLSFVPFAALFDGAGFRDAFAASFQGFARNPLPLLAWGVLSFALLIVGLLTNGIGLLLALPWSAASSYAAWKDVFDVR
ncbi:MAG: hypothetical protein ACREX6_05100 [Casimicrobiaceae bacterium]